MTPEDPLLQVWTLILKNRWEKYNEWALLALIAWCESHGLGMSKGATLDVKTWVQAGRHILSAASAGSETAINVIKPWRLVMDLLEQFKREREPKTAEGLPLAPPAKASGKSADPGEAGGADATPGKRERRTAKKSQHTVKTPGIMLMPPAGCRKTVAALPSAVSAPETTPSHSEALPSSCQALSC